MAMPPPWKPPPPKPPPPCPPPPPPPPPPRPRSCATVASRDTASRAVANTIVVLRAVMNFPFDGQEPSVIIELPARPHIVAQLRMANGKFRRQQSERPIALSA